MQKLELWLLRKPNSFNPVQQTSPVTAAPAGAVATEGASSSEPPLWVRPETGKQSGETAVGVRKVGDQAPSAAGVRTAHRAGASLLIPKMCPA